MEEPNPSLETQVPKPPNPTPENLPTTEIQNKKRKIDNPHLHNSTYFKIRAIVKDLRPSFIEVLRAPDFHNCKAAHDIQKQMQTLMELSKQLRTETVSSGNPMKPLETQPMVAEIREVPLERRGEDKADQPQPEKIPNKAVEDKLLGETTFENQPGGGFVKSYIIGGSPVGWNFMTYPGSKSVYYGETKARFVARQLKS